MTFQIAISIISLIALSFPLFGEDGKQEIKISTKEIIKNEDVEIIYTVKYPDENTFRNLSLNVRITPKSGGVEVSSSRALDAFKVELVRIEAGKEEKIDLTQLGKLDDKQKSGFRSESFLSADAGESLDVEIPLSLYYDLSVPGIFKLKLTQKISIGKKSLKIDVPPLVFPF